MFMTCCWYRGTKYRAMMQEYLSRLSDFATGTVQSKFAAAVGKAMSIAEIQNHWMVTMSACVRA